MNVLSLTASHLAFLLPCCLYYLTMQLHKQLHQRQSIYPTLFKTGQTLKGFVNSSLPALH